MKEGSVLINNSRGELTDEDAVIAAVESGKLERYITDFPSDKLIGVKNIICVPHLGASTPEAEDNCAAMAAQELVDYIENGNITHSVNFPDVSAPRSSVSRLAIMHGNVEGAISAITSIIPETISTSQTSSINPRAKKHICFSISIRNPPTRSSMKSKNLTA